MRKILRWTSAFPAPRPERHKYTKEERIMKRYIVTPAVVLALCFSAGAVWAVGTPVNTEIRNQATANYFINSNPLSSSSATVYTYVAEVIDVTVIWQDAPVLNVFSGDNDQALAFLVTNTGNGNETFDLSATSTLGGDDFDPVLQSPALYADTNTNGVYDVGTDLAIAGSTVSLARDTGALVFVVNNIPAGITTDLFTGISELTVTSQTGTGAGTVVANGGDGGTVDAVVGNSGGAAAVSGTYQVLAAQLTILKSAAVSNSFGGTEPIPTATISYTIEVGVIGGTANTVVVTDAIPADTTYTNNTLRWLQNIPPLLTDVLDADPGVATANTITVNLGNISAASGTQTITFDVTID